MGGGVSLNSDLGVICGRAVAVDVVAIRAEKWASNVVDLNVISDVLTYPFQFE